MEGRFFRAYSGKYYSEGAGRKAAVTRDDAGNESPLHKGVASYPSRGTANALHGQNHLGEPVSFKSHSEVWLRCRV